MQPDRSADICPCGCQGPYRHNLHLVSSHEIVATAVAERIRESYGLITELNPKLQAALERIGQHYPTPGPTWR